MALAADNDLGKRVAAACAYRGVSRVCLADALNISPFLLERFQAGVDELSNDDGWRLIDAIAGILRLPLEFFTVDFLTLPCEGPPEVRSARLERKVEELLDGVPDWCTAVEAFACTQREFAGVLDRGAVGMDGA
jgi:hypothetical protein